MPDWRSVVSIAALVLVLALCGPAHTAHFFIGCINWVRTFAANFH